MSSEPRGVLLVVSAPSGTGKTTVVRKMIATTPGVVFSRSYTSRAPRGGERDGADYHFVTRERFIEMREHGEFLEWAEVFGHLYGTRASDTEAVLESGLDLVLVIDVQGARQVRTRGVPSVLVFLLPPDFASLEARLRGRSEDADEVIAHRLRVAREELRAYGTYDYLVVNEHLDTCVETLKAIVLAERARASRVRGRAEALIRDAEMGGEAGAGGR